MAYKTVSDLIKAFREDEKDTVAPYFWSDDQLVRWTNEALTELAERSMSIYDDESTVTLVPYGVGEDRFVLDPCIIDVIDAWIEGQPHCHLSRNPASFGNGYRGGYWLAYSGCSSHFHFDGAGQLRLHPKPAAAGELRLRVVRRPVKDLEKCDRVPDLLPHDVRHLLPYIAYKAYRVNDAETFNKASSDEHLQNFENACQTVREQAILRRGDCTRPIRSNW